MSLSAGHMKRYRGVVLKLVYTNHLNQHSRMDHVMLWYAMRGVGCGVGENDVLTLLQDLCDRSYIRYIQKQNRVTNETEITQIEITGAGRDIREGTRTDPAVEL